jgi:di/tricarboxylate transporter/CRP-like cAMP-binding protein
LNLDERVPLFSGLSKLEQAKLLGDLEELEYAEGEMILGADTPATWLYFLLEGKVEIAHLCYGEFVPVNILTAGQLFGEASLTGESPGDLRVKALAPVRLYRLPVGKFQRLMQVEQRLASNLVKVLAFKLTGSGSELAQTKSVLTKYAAQLWDSVGPAPTVEAAPSVLPAVAATVAVEKADTPPTGLVRALNWLKLQGWRPISSVLSLLVAVSVLRFVQAPAPVPAVAAILVWAAWNWLTGILPDYVTAMTAVVLLVIAGLVSPAVALSGFASPSWFLLLGVFGIGAAVTRSGLLYRLALHMLRLFPPTYRGQSFALALAGLISTPLLPSANGRTAMASLLAKELNEAMRLPPLGRGSAGMAMASFLGFGQMYFMFLNGTSVCLVVWSLMPEPLRSGISWISWLGVALPLGLLVFGGCYLAILYMYPPEKSSGVSRRTILAQLQVLGSLTRTERITVFVLGSVLIGFLTQGLHGINPAWLALAGFLILTGMNIVDKAALKGMDWGFMLLIGALVSLTEVTAKTGISTYLTSWVGSFLEPLGSSPYLFIAALSVLTLAVSLVVTAQQAIIIMVMSLVPITVHLGYSPFVVALVVLAMGGGWILPQQNPVYMTVLAGTEGKAFTHKQVRPLAIVQALITLLAVLASIPFWQALGLIPG